MSRPRLSKRHDTPGDRRQVFLVGWTNANRPSVQLASYFDLIADKILPAASAIGPSADILCPDWRREPNHQLIPHGFAGVCFSKSDRERDGKTDRHHQPCRIIPASYPSTFRAAEDERLNGSWIRPMQIALFLMADRNMNHGLCHGRIFSLLSTPRAQARPLG
ncbi:hypothetical protein LY76DRAFT_205992 [Colletotrichum caudatum]|nr:hypothetical protein LY76DRAFT_205992 [Colletotrichum caudatum]